MDFPSRHFIVVADIQRSLDFYEKVFGATILSRGDGDAPGYLRIANTWMIINVGGGPTPDKSNGNARRPGLRMGKTSSFMNIRVCGYQKQATNYGRVEEPSSSSPSRSTNTAKRG